MMTDELSAGQGRAEVFGGAERPPSRRRVRMTRAPGQTLVLSSFGGGAGEAEPIEIRVAEMGAGGAATLDFLLPDHIFVEHKETMDSVQALFQAQPHSHRGLED